MTARAVLVWMLGACLATAAVGLRPLSDAQTLDPASSPSPEVSASATPDETPSAPESSSPEASPSSEASASPSSPPESSPSPTPTGPASASPSQSPVASPSATTSAARTPIRINFQPRNTPAVCGYTQDNGGTYGARNALTYGWNADHSSGTRDRNKLDDQRLDTLAHFEANGAWEIELPNGAHDVTVSIGDTAHRSYHTINVEGVNYWNNIRLNTYEFRQETRTVTVSDGRLTIDQGALRSGDTHINYVEIDAVGTVPACTLPTASPSPSASTSPSTSPSPSPSKTPSPTSTPSPSPSVAFRETKVNFQLRGSPAVCGYMSDYGDLYGDRGPARYGWNTDHTDVTRDRGMVIDQLLDTLTHFHAGGIWEIEVPNGPHTVTAVIGDPGFSSTHTLNVEGVSYWNRISLGVSEFVQATKVVNVTDGKLTLDQGRASDKATRINLLVIDPDYVPDNCPAPSPTPTRSASPTPSKTPMPKPSKTPTPSPSVTKTPTPSPSITKTPTPTPSRTPTPKPSPTPTELPEGTRTVRVNFQLAGAPRVCGFAPDVGRTFAARNGDRYGWNFDHGDVTRDREVKGDQKLDTLAHFHGAGKWELRLPRGMHRVTISIGDASYPSTHTLNVEGTKFWRDAALKADEFRQITRMVPVTDGRLTLDQGFAEDKATRINYIVVNGDGPPPECDKPEPAPKVGTPQPVEDKPRTTGGGGSLGARPYGLSGLTRVFGQKCSDKANNARTWFPSAGGRGKYGYVYYHSKLARKVGGSIMKTVHRRKRAAVVDYGVWGYSCRIKRGGTTWSVHSWGAAIDTNTLYNPFGATRWDGRGSNGRNYHRWYPKLWLGQNFYWGINFRDPMHFQYVAGY